MKISLVQFSPVWESPAKNRDALKKLLAGIPSTDLIILPEMFSTGFVTDPAGVAESDGKSLRFMQETAAVRGCAVAGSLAVEVEGSFRNRFYFVNPDGSEVHYDKHHLFTYGGEHHRFTAGQKPVVAQYNGVRILLQICYDLRFPVFSRNRLQADGSALYDLALYVASWPDVRTDAWDALLKARAIENQCFVAGVNRVGSDPGNNYSGHSVLLDPRGQVLAACKEYREEVSTCEIDLEDLRAFRNRFPVLQDAD